MLHRHVPRAALLIAGTVAALSLFGAGEHGLDLHYLDTSTSPCRDFFQYANGAWLRTEPIPADYSVWGVDEEIEQRNLGILKGILENAASQPATHGTITQQIGDFYAAAMDEASIERADATPLQSELAEVAALKSAGDVAALVRTWHTRGIDVVFELQAQEDLKDSDVNIAYAGQGGLGLPDRDYYLRQDAKSVLLRVRYRTHIARMLRLIGDANAAEAAAWVLQLETTLAKASLDPVALRDPVNSYHIHTTAQADALTPRLAWSALFTASGRDDVQRFSLAQPDFFSAVDKALSGVPVSHWQAYLRWHLLDDAAPYLSQRFVDADFDFRSRTLRGIKVDKPRWKRVIASTDAALGEALGQAYVAQVMPPEARQRALELVANLKAAMRARIGNLDWMSDETKRSALAKLDALGTKIGYPERWRDYSKLEITRDSYYANIRLAVAFEARRQFAKFDRPVDRSEWDMTPQTVNAYNNPMRNEIVFPAAQLLPPYFDAGADDAVNYGAIGAVIGHEMLHSFDDQGSKFDAHGNLAGWWSSEDRARFDARAAVLVRQFADYVPIDSLHVNGQLTLGENIADLGGLLVAYDAFKSTEQGRSTTPADGLAPDQRFFIAYAQSWRELQRPEQLRRQVQSNEHAPAKYRVNGPVSNVAAFAQAFGCKAGDAMVRSGGTNVKIW
jgi:putative endopeptidase